MRKYIFILGCIAFASCYMHDKDEKEVQEMAVPGKLLIEYYLSDSCYLVENGDSARLLFKLPNNDTVQYMGLKWMHKMDGFICTEYFQKKDSGAYQGNFVRLDSAGKLVERLYIAPRGWEAHEGYLSRNDGRLLFSTNKCGIRLNEPEDSILDLKTIVVMDFETKEIIRKVNPVSHSSVFSLYESPWLVDEKQFIYEIPVTPQGVVPSSTSNGKNIPGLHLYDITTGKDSLIVADAEEGICSPVDYRVAYKKNDVVYVLDLKSGVTKKLWEKRKREVGGLHWTPDGKYIYVWHDIRTNYSKFFSDFKTILIDAETGKTIPFDIPSGHFSDYTWK